MPITASELIINEDGSIYHLGLRPEDVAPTIITVGDPDRVEMISNFFDHVEVKVNKREFVSHTGSLDGKRITVISTGIGTDNVDIVLNELDALVNVNFQTREIKDDHITLDIIRIGTSGTLRSEIQMDEIILSRGAIGLDGLMHFYERIPDNIEVSLLDWEIFWPIKPYFYWGSELLLTRFNQLGLKGITITNTGFYGPQSRKIRLDPIMTNFFDKLENHTIEGCKITNLEMETAGLYGLSHILGHQCISINAILANRALCLFSKDPAKTVRSTIESVLQLI